MTVTVRFHDLAHGGDGVGRIDGKIVFVPGVLSGETAEIEIVDDRADFSRGRVTRLVEASPHRIDPPCPHFASCGGCQWQFLDRSHQAQAKRNTLIGQLQHLGGLDEPPVDEVEMPGPDFGYRNRMDFSVRQGRPALKEWRSKQLVALDQCLLLAAPLADVFARLGDLERARSLTLRLGESSGEALAILTGPVPRSAETWDVPVVRPDGRQVHGRRAHVTETIANARFRVTGNAFFQNNSHGAGALVSLVDEMLGLDRSDRLLDGYSGVGLFACTAGQAAGSVICVESDERALGDLQANLEDNAVPAPDIVVAPFEDVGDESWTAAVVDPPRTGLRRLGVDAVTGPLPRSIAYVSCDPASLARDTRYLAEKGYALRRVVPVDMFPQTYHLESVALFELVSSQSLSGP